MGWMIYVLAYGAFLGAHLIPMRPALRAALIRALGRRGYLWGYSALSLLLLWALIVAAGRAPVVTLWDQSIAARWLVNLTMPLVFVLIALSVGRPNPLSLGGAGRFDPARPGIAGVMRHPLLGALALWAGVHLLANGDLAHIGLFGGMLVFALAGIAGLEARNRARLGAGYAQAIARAPLLPLRHGWPPGGLGAGWPVRLMAGLALWAGVFHLHPLLFGASPHP